MNINYLFTVWLNLSSQTRNQKFFRAGEVSWDYGTFINILLKTPEKKAPQGKAWEFFLPDTPKTTFWIGKFNSKMDKFKTIFKKSIFKIV